jgi:hypothetical protein
MKYVFALVTMIVISMILVPVMMVRWSDDGLNDVAEGGTNII